MSACVRGLVDVVVVAVAVVEVCVCCGCGRALQSGERERGKRSRVGATRLQRESRRILNSVTSSDANPEGDNRFDKISISPTACKYYILIERRNHVSLKAQNLSPS